MTDMGKVGNLDFNKQVSQLKMAASIAATTGLPIDKTAKMIRNAEEKQYKATAARSARFAYSGPSKRSPQQRRRQQRPYQRKKRSSTSPRSSNSGSSYANSSRNNSRSSPRSASKRHRPRSRP